MLTENGISVIETAIDVVYDAVVITRSKVVVYCMMLA